MKKIVMFAFAISLSFSLFAEVVSVAFEKFGKLQDYVEPSFLEVPDPQTVDKKEKLAIRNKAVRVKALNDCISKIDEQIMKCRTIAENLTHEDLNHYAYLVDVDNDKEAFFLNCGNSGWIDFYREEKNIWCRCKLSSGIWMFYQAGPLFEQLVEDTKWLVIKKGQGKYFAYSDKGNVSSKMENTDKYFKTQEAYFNLMLDNRANLFQKFFANN